MTALSPEAVWKMTNTDLLKVLDKGFLMSKRRRLHFYAPSFMYYKTPHYCSSPSDFPTISVTGKTCASRCRHCAGIILKTMYPATTPKRLWEICERLKRGGALGCLISGGCLPDGSVPLEGFVDVIARVKRELRSIVFVHTGILGVDLARALKSARVDGALIDVIGSDATVREVCSMKVTVKDYANSLKALSEAGVPFVPHVLAGLHYGKLKGEFDALEMISCYKPSALVVIAFMPVRGTEMANTRPPTPLSIARVMATARLMFPKTPLVLGCMRPKGKYRSKTDILALKAGADAIAFPEKDAVEFAKQKGYETTFSSVCCSQIYMDIMNESTLSG